MLTPEQEEKIKRQIIDQIEKTFPEDKKNFAISQIESMDSEQLEAFLRQNKLIKSQGNEKSASGCVFCSIASGQISSFKINENKDSVAVLEINPVSRGHSMIIPKEHVVSADKLKKSIFSLAKEVSKRIKAKFEPKNVSISSSNVMGHEILNIIPVYDSESIDSQRVSANHDELSDMQKMLEKKPKVIVKKPKKIAKKPGIETREWLPKRIP